MKIQNKNIKHLFSQDERNGMSEDLARAYGAIQGLESELDQVKASYKAKTAEVEAKIQALSTAIVNGFEMRNARCHVVYKPEEKKKYFFLEACTDGADPVAVEEMSPEDFQAELLEAESKFEARTEFELFPPPNDDFGTMVVGRFSDKWYAALRVQVGAHRLEERLDSEQPCAKKRPDMIKRAGKRLTEWLQVNLGKEDAKGFEEPIFNAIMAQKDREE